MLEQIKEVICGYVDVEPEDITENSRLISDLKLSSLDIVMIFVELEKLFDVKIPEKLYQKVKTVGGLKEYIENNK